MSLAVPIFFARENVPARRRLLPFAAMRVFVLPASYLFLAACGPEAPPGGSEAEASTGATTSATSTAASATTEPTTGASACAAVALPQGLPPGTGQPHWLWQGDARQVYFSAPGLSCELREAPCEQGGPSELQFIYVALGDGHQAVGVYPAGGFLSGKVLVAAVFLVPDGGSCALEFAEAAGGEVEVLAIDDDCVSIDIRGVPAFELADGTTVDPNGSATAPFCPTP